MLMRGWRVTFSFIFSNYMFLFCFFTVRLEDDNSSTITTHESWSRPFKWVKKTHIFLHFTLKLYSHSCASITAGRHVCGVHRDAGRGGTAPLSSMKGGNKHNVVLVLKSVVQLALRFRKHAKHSNANVSLPIQTCVSLLRPHWAPINDRLFISFTSCVASRDSINGSKLPRPDCVCM